MLFICLCIIKDYNTHAKEEEEMPIRMPSFQPPMNPKKAKNTVYKLPDDDNGASPVKGKQSTKDVLLDFCFFTINFVNLIIFFLKISFMQFE